MSECVEKRVSVCIPACNISLTQKVTDYEDLDRVVPCGGSSRGSGVDIVVRMYQKKVSDK